MDFKKLLNTIDSVQTRPETPAAPVLPTAVQLNEDAQLRVLSGRTTYVAEAKKKAEEDKKEEAVKEEMKVGDSKKTAKGGTVTKTKTGIVHKAGPGSYGGSDDKDTDPDADDETKAKKKAKKESIDPEQFKSKFLKMVEAKKDEKPKAKKEKKMEEAAKPDFLDVDGDGDKKEPMKKAAKEKGGDKKDGKKGMSAKQEKFFGKKKTVKESVEQKLTFKQMVELVQESGGQQQIDPMDKELFNWATRVATNKLGEGMKAELYAGLIYERNGGVFEMYDVLSEAQK
jgi:hypothetical protein